MAIIGVESILYGVDDVARSTRFFEDFGLPLVSKSERLGHFRLQEGSSVFIRKLGDPELPRSGVVGAGGQQVIWGVDCQRSLDELAADLGRDHDLITDADGTLHFLTTFGLYIGLRVFQKRPVVYAPDGVNATGHVTRLNTMRKWKRRARPTTIQHVVWAVPDVNEAWVFFRDRLRFRLSDIQPGLGVFGRCEGASDHHNVYFLDASAAALGQDNKLRWHHANFGVEDIDEIMIGANHMERAGWDKSHWGLGRHRIASALFFYLPCPAGGEAEYGADSDRLDDNWVPRIWNPNFGFVSFLTNMPAFLRSAPDWDVRYCDPNDLYIKQPLPRLPTREANTWELSDPTASDGPIS